MTNYVLYPKVKTVLKPLNKGVFIGSGSFANVYKYSKDKVLKILPIKRKKGKTLNKREIQNIFMHLYLYDKIVEIRQYIPKIYEFGYILDDNGNLSDFYIVMTNLGAELEDIFKNKVKLSIVEKLNIFIQVVKCVRLMHRNGFIHRDLKPGNIIVKKNNGKYKAYVIDFGFLGHKIIDIKQFSGALSNLKNALLELKINKNLANYNFIINNKILTDCSLYNKKLNCVDYMGSLYYVSTEFIAEHYSNDSHCDSLYKLNKKIGHKHDIYALGIIFLQLLCDGCIPIDDPEDDVFFGKICYRDDIDTYEKLFSVLDDKLNLLNKYNFISEFKELIFGMMRHDPEKRFNATQILEHISKLFKSKSKNKILKKFSTLDIDKLSRNNIVKTVSKKSSSKKSSSKKSSNKNKINLKKQSLKNKKESFPVDITSTKI